MKIKLTAWAMGQEPGSLMELKPHTAELLIRRGVAVAVDFADDKAPGITAVLTPVPEKNKALSARQFKGK